MGDNPSIVGANQKINGEVVVTEKEAKSRPCPRVMISTFIRPGPGCCGLVGINMDDFQDDFNCIGQACGMWVWTNEGHEGYCELIKEGA